MNRSETGPAEDAPAVRARVPASFVGELAGWAAGLVLGVGLAVAVVGPSFPALATNLPGFMNDDAIHGIYLHFQVHDALGAGRWDLSDPMSLFPTGAPNASVNGGNILEMVVSRVTRLFLPWPEWLSAAYFAWIPLNLLAFLPLGRHLWGRWGPSLAAAAAWAIFPPVLVHIISGRLTQAALVGVPIAVLGLLRVVETGGRRASLLAGAGMALSAWGYWFLAVFLATLTPLFLLWGLRHRPFKPLLRDLGLAALVSALLVAPLVVVILQPMFRDGWMPPPRGSSTDMSPVFSNALQLVSRQPPQLQDWLPWVWLPGMAWSLFKGRRRLLWLGLGLVSVIFALGPAQILGGVVWPLPYYALWRWVPGFDRLFHPDRWLLVGGLFAVIYAVDGLARSPRRWVRALLWLLPVLGFVQLREGRLLPFRTWEPEIAGIWEVLAQEPGQGGGIIVYPLLRAPMTSRYLPFVQRPFLGGMLEDKPTMIPPAQLAFMSQSNLLMGLWLRAEGKSVKLRLWHEDLQRLRDTGFDTIVLDARSLALRTNEDAATTEAELSQVLGEPRYADSTGAIWDLPRFGVYGTPPDPGEITVPTPRRGNFELWKPDPLAPVNRMTKDPHDMPDLGGRAPKGNGGRQPR